jgi:hypothetical protein
LVNSADNYAERMQIKLQYEADFGPDLPKYLRLPELPKVGEILTLAAHVAAEVLHVTPTPHSMFQAAVAVVRPLKAAG